MEEKFFTAEYNFTIGSIKFRVEIDDSFSSENLNINYLYKEKKTLHYHSLHEMFFVFEDDIYVTFKDKSVDYRNCILLIPPNTNHYTIRSNDYRLLFSCTPKGGVKDDFYNFFINTFASNKIICIENSKTNLKVLLKELFLNLSNFPSSVNDDVIVSFLKIIFYNIYTLSGAPLLAPSKHKLESRHIIIENLVNKCTSQNANITLSTVAKALYLSEKQTAKIIYKYYGKTLSEMINEEKLNYATFLLSSTNLSISEIALKCNFNSENYFYHLFKKKLGITPLKYRKNLNKD